MERETMRCLVWSLIALLVILHQDYWQWKDATLVFGFLPWTLAWHAGISLAAAAVWVLAVRYCWPEHLEEPEPATQPADGDREEGGP